MKIHELSTIVGIVASLISFALWYVRHNKAKATGQRCESCVVTITYQWVLAAVFVAVGFAFSFGNNFHATAAFVTAGITFFIWGLVALLFRSNRMPTMQ